MIVSDIQVTSTGIGSELQAQVKSDIARKPFLLRYCFPRGFEDFISPHNGDPFLAALLLPAMKNREALEIPAPVSPILLSATNEIQTLYKSWDKSLGNVQVNASVRKEKSLPIRRASRRGLFFSCGVDSYYSLLKNLTNHPADNLTITDLMVVRGFDTPFQGPNSTVFQTLLANARIVSRELRKNVLPVATNARDFGTEFVRWDRLYHGAAMASVGLALESVFDRIHIASSFSHDQPWGSHPALDPLWSTECCSFSHDGSDTRRVEKIRFVAQLPIVMDTLRVCTLRPISGNIYNCGICEKCSRTMVGLHVAGALVRCTTLPHYIDLRVLRSIPIPEDVREFTEELVTELGSSETDLAIRSALEEALSASGRRRAGRGLFSPLFFLAPYVPPLLRLWVGLWRALRRSPPSSIFDLLRFS